MDKIIVYYIKMFIFIISWILKFHFKYEAFSSLFKPIWGLVKSGHEWPKRLKGVKSELEWSKRSIHITEHSKASSVSIAFHCTSLMAWTWKDSLKLFPTYFFHFFSLRFCNLGNMLTNRLTFRQVPKNAITPLSTLF